MKPAKKYVVVFVIFLLFGSELLAQNSGEIRGFWKTFDEKNGDSLAIVEIYSTDSSFAGRIRKLFLRPHQGAGGICARCPEPWTNQPVNGLEIMWSLKEEQKKFSGGKLLNPGDGKIYSVDIVLQDSVSADLKISAGLFGMIRRTKKLRRTSHDVADAGFAGLWHLISDEFEQPASLIRVEKHKKFWRAKIVETYLMPDEGPQAICVECKDDLKDQPLSGLQILKGLKAEGDKWGGGEILDPGNGKYYRCSVKLLEDDRLEVRGHLGPFSRSQVWRRVER